MITTHATKRQRSTTSVDTKRSTVLGLNIIQAIKVSVTILTILGFVFLTWQKYRYLKKLNQETSLDSRRRGKEKGDVFSILRVFL